MWSLKHPATPTFKRFLVVGWFQIMINKKTYGVENRPSSTLQSLNWFHQPSTSCFKMIASASKLIPHFGETPRTCTGLELQGEAIKIESLLAKFPEIHVFPTFSRLSPWWKLVRGIKIYVKMVETTWKSALKHQIFCWIFKKMLPSDNAKKLY